MQLIYKKSYFIFERLIILNILVTGSKGFIGKNLISELRNRKITSHIFEYDIDSDSAILDKYCAEADIIYHLAGINRPKEESEFMKVNYGLTSVIVNKLKEKENTCPVIFSSSIQAELDNPYGRSKRAGEELLIEYGKQTGAKVLIYRLPNVFGKWCKPNYNSVVATFCYNIARNLPIVISDPNRIMKLVYVDDVVEGLLSVLSGEVKSNDYYCSVGNLYEIRLGELADLIYSFKKSREDKTIPNMSDSFIRKLYSTYLSYLPEDQFKYILTSNSDYRGSFTEFIRTNDRGQLSINISKPGIVKGNHWHRTKNEKFLVVSGKGVIRLRRIDSNEIIKYFVSSDRLEVIDIPPGFTHNIENLGETDMVTVMWANECFDPENPDTFYMEV